MRDHCKNNISDETDYNDIGENRKSINEKTYYIENGEKMKVRLTQT